MIPDVANLSKTLGAGGRLDPIGRLMMEDGKFPGASRLVSIFAPATEIRMAQG
jgi:hypothetical protein